MRNGPVSVLLRLDDDGLTKRARRWCLDLGFSLLCEEDRFRGPVPGLVILVTNREDYIGEPRIHALHPEILVVILPETSPDRALEILSTRLAGMPVRSRALCDSQTAALVGESPIMRQLCQEIEDVARSNCNVIVTGETGSGKELVARSIHNASARHNGPFVSINCAALPDSLVESELFGYEKGAFTGAHGSYPGKLTLGNDGTVFLDEVGDMSLFAQAKLLRAIEERCVFRLGAVRSVPVNFRLISATNRDLLQESRKGLFRLDLYYRLKVACIRVPPLRERRDDIPQLAVHYSRQIAEAAGDMPPEFSADAIAAMYAYAWPGNVRELRNVIEAALVRSRGARRIELRQLSLDAAEPPPLMAKSAAAAAFSGEEERIRLALEESHGNKSAAAEKLRWSRMTLYRKLSKYNLE